MKTVYSSRETCPCMLCSKFGDGDKHALLKELIKEMMEEVHDEIQSAKSCWDYIKVFLCFL